MKIDDFLELVHTRRSMRRFKPDVVTSEILNKILEAGRWAMSGANAQPWEFVAVRDTRLLARLAESWFEPHKEMYAVEQARIEALRLTPLREFATTAAFKSAPVLVVLLGDRRTYQATVLGANYLVTEGAPDAIFLKNMANATQNINLAAAAAGLGAMWISITSVWADSIKRILDIPDMLEVHTMVALGYPAYLPMPGSRRPLKDIVHYDKYDTDRYRSADDIQNFLYSLRNKTEIPYKIGYMPGKE